MIDLDELSEEEIEAVMQTPAFQKSLKYRRLAQGIEVLEEDDAIYRQLVATITEQHGSVSTRSSVEEVLDLFVQEVNTYTEGMDIEVEDEEGSHDFEDLMAQESDDR
jgi:ActR/RegA family two-component response regulator